MNATDLIRMLFEVREDFAKEGIPPIEINSGCCADFATVVWERLGKPSDEVLEFVDDESLGAGRYTHTFLRFKGRYYDAEAPEGVDDWQDLPIFQRLSR